MTLKSYLLALKRLDFARRYCIQHYAMFQNMYTTSGLSILVHRDYTSIFLKYGIELKKKLYMTFQLQRF